MLNDVARFNKNEKKLKASLEELKPFLFPKTFSLHVELSFSAFADAHFPVGRIHKLLYKNKLKTDDSLIRFDVSGIFSTKVIDVIHKFTLAVLCHSLISTFVPLCQSALRQKI